MYVGVGRFRGRVGRDKSGPYGDGVWGAMTVITEIRAPTYSMLEGMYYPPSSGHYGQRASLLRLGLCTITAYGMSPEIDVSQKDDYFLCHSAANTHKGKD